MTVDLRDEMLNNAQTWRNEAEDSTPISSRRAIYKVGSGLMAGLIYVVILLEKIKEQSS